MLNLAIRIEKVRTRLGRYPDNEEELVSEMNREMPLTAWGHPIRYRKCKHRDAFFCQAVTERGGEWVYVYFSDRKPPEVQMYRF